MKYYTNSAQLALDTIVQKPTTGIPTGVFHIMEHAAIERLANAAPGAYLRDPHRVYMQMYRNVGVNIAGQYLADNPLTMGEHGYEHGANSATTGLDAYVDGVLIDSPEAVARHVEEVDIPRLAMKIENFDAAAVIEEVTLDMSRKAMLFGDDILTVGYGHFNFPTLQYCEFGYENYLMAYAMYPELFARQFELQGTYGELHNKSVVQTYIRNGYPLFQRLDHDMADSRSTLVSLASLEKIWLPQFARAIRPAVDAGFKLIWHCDGYLLDFFPLLLEAGIKGFQGFQYEHGMDYKKICDMRAKDGSELIIVAGVSVSKTLPFGTADDIAQELKFLVDNGPKTGLFLGTSSSCVPGTPWENIQTLVEGLQYYRKYGRI